MTAYRAYQLDQKHRIIAGDWIAADTDQEARAKAAELCEDGVESIELWKATVKVDELDCPPEGAAAPRKRS